MTRSSLLPRRFVIMRKTWAEGRSIRSSGPRIVSPGELLIVIFLAVSMLSILPVMAIGYDGGSGTRAANDVGVVSTTLNDAGEYPLAITSFDVRVANNDDTAQHTFLVNCTAKRVSTGDFETVAGNTSKTVAASSSTNAAFTFTPQFEDDYLIEASVTMAGDTDPSNDMLSLTITVVNKVDAAVAITSHQDSMMYPDTSQIVSARVNNSGTMPIDDDIRVNLTISNNTAPVFYDEVITSSANVHNPGDSTTIDMAAWNPPALGQYTLRVSISLPPDMDVTNNVTQISIQIASAATPMVKVTAQEPVEQLIPPGHSTKEGGYQSYGFVITNIGLVADSYNWYSYSGHGWIDGNNPTTGTTGVLQPGEETAVIYVDIKVPIDAGMTIDRLNLTAVSLLNATVKATADVNTVTQEIVDVQVFDPLSKWGVPGGDPIVYVYSVKNTGNVAERFNVAIAGVQTGWRAELLSPAGGQTPYLAPGDSYPATVRVWIPKLNYDTRVEDHTYYTADGFATVEAWSPTTGVTDSGTSITYVDLIYTVDMKVVPPERYVEPDVNRSQAVSFHISVRNVCNYRESVAEGRSIINFSIDNNTPVFESQWGAADPDEAARYTASINVLNVTLDVGETDSALVMRVTVPHDPISGSCTVNLTANSTGDGAGPGIEIPATASVLTIVNQSADVNVLALTDEYYPDFDNNSNGRPDWREGAPMETLTVRFNVTNLGNGRDRFNLTARVEPFGNSTTSEDWSPGMYGNRNRTRDLLPLIFNVSLCFQTVHANLTIPSGMPIDSYCWIRVTATSVTDEDVSSSDRVKIHVIEGHSVDLEPEENTTRIYPDDRATFQVNVTNAGNGVDTIDLSLNYPMVQGWQAILSTSSLLLGRGEMRTVNLTVNASSLADADAAFKVKVTGRSREDPTEYDEVNCTTIVLQRTGVDVKVLEPSVQHARPGDLLYYLFSIENTGNGNDTFTANITTYPYENWSVSSRLGSDGNIVPGSGREIELTAFQMVILNITVMIPHLPDRPTREGLTSTGLIAFSNNSVVLEVTSHTDINATDSEYGTIIVDPSSRIIITTTNGVDTSQQVIPGSSVTYPLSIRNAGNQEDTVGLFMDGEERYLRWSTLGNQSFYLDIGGSAFSSLVVTPQISDLPYWHEQADIHVKARTDDNRIHSSGTIYTKIVMMYIENRYLSMDVGTSTTVPILLMNVPKEADATGMSSPLPATITIAVDPMPGTTLNGWHLQLSPNATGGQDTYLATMFSSAYQSTRAYLTIFSPESTSSSPLLCRLTATATDGREDEESVYVTPVYFSATLGNDGIVVNREFVEEGDTFMVSISLIVSGTRAQINLPVYLDVNGKRVDERIIPLADPTQGSGTRLYVVTFNLTADTLQWYEKEGEMKIKVTIGGPPDASWVHITDSRYTGGNVRLSLEKSVGIYDASFHPVIVLAAIFVLILSFVIFFILAYYQERSPWFYIACMLSLSLLGAAMFSFPIHYLRLGAMVNNVVGLSILVIFTFILLPAIIYLSFDAIRSYLENRLYDLEMKKRIDSRRRKAKYNLPMEEGQKEGDIPEGHASPIRPYLIILLTSLSGYLPLILGLSLYATLDQGVTYPVNVLLFTKYFIPVNLFIIALYLLVPMLAVFFFMRTYDAAFREILDANEAIERLKLDAERHIFGHNTADAMAERHGGARQKFESAYRDEMMSDMSTENGPMGFIEDEEERGERPPRDRRERPPRDRRERPPRDRRERPPRDRRERPPRDRRERPPRNGRRRGR